LSILLHVMCRAQLEMFSGRGLRAKAEAAQHRAMQAKREREQDIALVRSLK
jgi:hypothetical protein